MEQVKARRLRTQHRLDTGQVGSPKELEGLQSELVALDRRIASLEDAELEVMEQLESTQSELDEVLARLGTIDARRAELVAVRDTAFGEIDAAATAGGDERARLAEPVGETLLAAYEKSRSQHGGVGAAALVQRSCSGCHLQLNAGDLHELANEPADAVLRCPECNRILVRTADSAI